MKRIFKLFLFLAMILSATLSFADVGTVVQTVINDFNPQIIPKSQQQVYILTLTITGAASNGSVPSTTIQGTAATGTNAKLLWGWFLYSLKTYPGSAAPNANYSVTIKDASGWDFLGGGAINNQSATIPVKTFAFPSGGSFSPVSGPLTIAVSGNSQGSANLIAVLEFVKFPMSHP